MGWEMGIGLPLPSFSPYFGKTVINDFDGLKIERYKRKKLEAGLSKKTINNHLSVLGTCLKAAKEWNGLHYKKTLKFWLNERI